MKDKQKKKEEISCPICNRSFSTSRSLTMHYRTCEREHQKKNENNQSSEEESVARRTKRKRDSNENEDQDINYCTADSKLVLEHSRESARNNIREQYRVHTETKTSGERERIVIVHNPITGVTDPAEYQLMEQDRVSKKKQLELVKSKHSYAEIDLLKILSNLNCHNSAYDQIMKWAQFWNSQKVLFDDVSRHRFSNRQKVLNGLIEENNLHRMRPFQKEVILSDSLFESKVNVTIFDFKQQLLSLLSDKELMKACNLVLPDEPGHQQICKDKISEINDSDWYHSAHKYYEKEKGTDSDRVICGIIFAIDKTHTDTKGKLCLESVNFTLSIFDTKTRRSNPQAWRSLGFINDLSAKYGGITKNVKNKSDLKKKVSKC